MNNTRGLSNPVIPATAGRLTLTPQIDSGSPQPGKDGLGVFPIHPYCASFLEPEPNSIGGKAFDFSQAFTRRTVAWKRPRSWRFYLSRVLAPLFVTRLPVANSTETDSGFLLKRRATAIFTRMPSTARRTSVSGRSRKRLDP